MRSLGGVINCIVLLIVVNLETIIELYRNYNAIDEDGLAVIASK